MFTGYTGTGLNSECTNINECEIYMSETQVRHRCASNANCTDTEGSYQCECHTGFSGDGIQCDGLFKLSYHCKPRRGNN